MFPLAGLPDPSVNTLYLLQRYLMLMEPSGDQTWPLKAPEASFTAENPEPKWFTEQTT